jgi:hypothetical protein
MEILYLAFALAAAGLGIWFFRDLLGRPGVKEARERSKGVKVLDSKREARVVCRRPCGDRVMPSVLFFMAAAWICFSCVQALSGMGLLGLGVSLVVGMPAMWLGIVMSARY